MQYDYVKIDARRAKVKALRDSGMGRQAIADKLGISYRTAARDLFYVDNPDTPEPGRLHWQRIQDKHNRLPIVRELVAKGLTSGQIAEEMGTTVWMVEHDRQRLISTGQMDVTRSDIVRADQRRGVALSMTRAGSSLKEIAKTLGVNVHTVSTYRKEFHIQGLIPDTKPYAPPHPPEFWDGAREMLEERMGYNEVARTLGCDSKSLKKHFPGYGLTQEEVNERTRFGRQFSRISEKLQSTTI